MNKVTYIEARGTNYEIGCAIGECLRERLIAHFHERQAYFREFAEKHHLSMRSIVESSQGSILKHFPRYLEELRGLADGSSLPLRDILLLCSEEVISNGATNQCTTFAFRGEQGAILAHNEDWETGYEDKLYVIRARPEKGPAFLSLAYLGTLGGSSVALNEHGIAFSGNSILDGAQSGVPKNIILRSQIEARSVDEFEDLATFQPRAIPNHSMAIDREGNIISVEVGLDEQSVFFTSGPYVHTNHPIHQSMAYAACGSMDSSKRRYRTAQKFISNHTLDEDLAKRILRSHENEPHTICIHSREGCHSHSQTVASAIVNLSEMSLSVTLGNPCRSSYEEFFL